MPLSQTLSLLLLKSKTLTQHLHVGTLQDKTKFISSPQEKLT